VSAPVPDSIVTASVSASAIRMLSSPAPERIEIFENVARLGGTGLSAPRVCQVHR
jgi:hypothetical protein